METGEPKKTVKKFWPGPWAKPATKVPLNFRTKRKTSPPVTTVRRGKTSPLRRATKRRWHVPAKKPKSASDNCQAKLDVAVLGNGKNGVVVIRQAPSEPALRGPCARFPSAWCASNQWGPCSHFGDGRWGWCGLKTSLAKRRNEKSPCRCWRQL
jgi:hypothetical protein